MTFILIKFSIPGWEKKFESLGEARLELLNHICSACLEGGEFDDAPPNQDDIYSLLGTPCGCEYGIEDDSEFEDE